jgi:predicted Fe-S protein YdhL (DUF1289 family)
MVARCGICGLSGQEVCLACARTLIEQHVWDLAEAHEAHVERISRRIMDLMRRVGDLEHDAGRGPA